MELSTQESNGLEVEGRRPVGRPKKTWSKVVEATPIMFDPRSGKLGTLKLMMMMMMMTMIMIDDDDNDDD